MADHVAISTLAEMLLALITDQPFSAMEKREVALHMLRLMRRVRETAQTTGTLREEHPL